MKWLQAFKKTSPQHKYAINAKMLGDDALLAWSNLGYWDDATSSYPQACRQLADKLAHSVHLNSKDHLLDLGCGQGASLLHWKTHYQVQSIDAVELQPECIAEIQKNLPQINHIYCESFLNLKNIPFKAKFDVVLCIDAAYHSHLNSFLKSVNSVLNSKGRFAFHYLVFSPEYAALNSFQKFKYRILLKCADVNIDHLMDQNTIKETMQNFGFENIQIENLSEYVLKGFSEYFMNKLDLKNQKSSSRESGKGIDAFKIKMTAKLCQKLYQDGIVDYVQISATRKA